MILLSIMIMMIVVLVIREMDSEDTIRERIE